jgi:hypothetical protein
VLKEISKFIEGLTLGPAPGWNIGVNMFAGHVPVKNSAGNITPVRYLAVLENAGGALLMDVGGVVAATPPATCWPKYIEKAVQLLNRARTYFTARTDAEQLFDYLDNTAGWELPDPAGGASQYIACVINAYAPPAPVGNPDEKGLYVFSTNYTWKIEKATCGGPT